MELHEYKSLKTSFFANLCFLNMLLGNFQANLYVSPQKQATNLDSVKQPSLKPQFEPHQRQQDQQPRIRSTQKVEDDNSPRDSMETSIESRSYSAECEHLQYN